MTAPRKLAVYVLALAAVLGVSVVVGSAVDPTGLANAEPEKTEHGGAMGDGMVPGLAAAADDYRLHVETDTIAANAVEHYRFRILDDDAPVTEFEIEHTKPMHVIVVRRDMVGFQHLHPEMDEGGTWETSLTVPDAGAYRVFADFVIDGEKRTLGTDLFVGGDFDPQPLPKANRVADAGDGYTVEMAGEAVAGEESALTFEVRRQGALVTDVSEYLGARGHLVALRDGDLAYLHVHADEDELRFEAEFPSTGSYRLFLQFRHDDKVRTAAFTIDAEEERS